jgi:hypothetical protein
MGKRIVNAVGCLLVVAFLAVCAGVLAYGLAAATLAGVAHGGDCPPASSLAGGACADPRPVLHTRRPTGATRAELQCERSDVERCPPQADGAPATTLAEPGYTPEPAGPPTDPH